MKRRMNTRCTSHLHAGNGGGPCLGATVPDCSQGPAGRCSKKDGGELRARDSGMGGGARPTGRRQSGRRQTRRSSAPNGDDDCGRLPVQPEEESERAAASGKSSSHRLTEWVDDLHSILFKFNVLKACASPHAARSIVSDSFQREVFLSLAPEQKSASSTARSKNRVTFRRGSPSAVGCEVAKK